MVSPIYNVYDVPLQSIRSIGHLDHLVWKVLCIVLDIVVPLKPLTYQSSCFGELTMTPPPPYVLRTVAFTNAVNYKRYKKP